MNSSEIFGNVEFQTSDEPQSKASQVDPIITSQFSSPEEMEIGKEIVDVYDITPENPKSDIPVLLAPGFSATPKAHEQHIENIVADGRRCISVKSPHGLKKHSIIDDNKSEYPQIELAKLAPFMEVLNQKGIDKADVVAHSEGTMYMLIAASLYPTRFRNMILVSTAGLTNKRGMFSLLRARVRETKAAAQRETKRTDGDDRQSEELKNSNEASTIIKSDLKRSIESARAISKFDAVKVIEKVSNHGVNIILVHGAGEELFLMEEVQRRVPKSAIKGFYSVVGGHDEMFYRPEGFSKIILLTLDILELRDKIKSITNPNTK